MYHIALDLRDRLVVVVGAGTVAERKIAGLRAAGARVRIVAPLAMPAIEAAADAGDLELHARPFHPSDLDGATLAFTATGIDEVDAAVVTAARARGILVDDTTDRARSDFATPLVHRVGDVSFAVETAAASPSFAIRLQRELRERFDGRYARAAENLGRARTYVKAVVPAELRGEVMRTLANREIDVLAAMNAMTVENEIDELVDRAVARATPVAEPSAPLVCATRASALALWQTRFVMAELAKVGLPSTILQISTKGDRIVDRSLAALGTDSIFVKELEFALRERRADYAVHSCKDLPSTLPEDMRLAAIGKRADPRDAFCSERYPSLTALPPGARVGTSSPRRRAQLGALRPDLTFEIIRGNVDTRLRKLRDGEFDAIILAMAGLTRLGVGATHTVPIDPELLIPAVGQGALAIEVRAEDGALAERIAATFTDRATELAVRAERAFLRTLRGGCQAPVGAHAIVCDGRLTMTAVIAAVDGSTIVRDRIEAAAPDVAGVEAEGERLAHVLLGRGGAALLAAATTATAPLIGHVLLLPRTQERPSTIAPALRLAGAEVFEVADSATAAATLGDRRPSVLLFPSSGSVAAIAEYLATLRLAAVRPVVATMGEASSAAATHAGFPPDVVATEPSIGAFVQSVTHYLLGNGVHE